VAQRRSRDSGQTVLSFFKVAQAQRRARSGSRERMAAFYPRQRGLPPPGRKPWGRGSAPKVRSVRCVASFPADFQGRHTMTAFIRSLCLAALLAAGTAWAQQPQTGNTDNPHSTKAKDKQDTGVSGSATNQQVQDAEKPNPHSVDNRKDEAKASGGQSSTAQGQQQNPQNPNETWNTRDRSNSGPGPGQASDMDHGQMSGMDHDAMMKNATPQQMLQRLHMSNQHEIEMANLAQQNGSDRIKTYAQALTRDHQDADQKVKDLAQKKSITLSDTPKNPQMQQKMETGKERFAALKGAEFDRAFTNRMSMEHRRMISMAQSWRQDCKDQDVCNLIDALLPKLQQHEQMANSLRGPAAQGRAPESTPR
jgi:putative membrane protein